MGRSTTGESIGTFHVLRLVEHVAGASGDIESRLRLIQEIFLARADVARAFNALDDASPATMKAISDWITRLLLSYRRTDVDLTIADFPTLPGLLGQYRPLIQNQFDSISLKFGPNYEDLSTKIETIETAAGRRAPVLGHACRHRRPDGRL